MQIWFNIQKMSVEQLQYKGINASGGTSAKGTTVQRNSQFTHITKKKTDFLTRLSACLWDFGHQMTTIWIMLLVLILLKMDLRKKSFVTSERG